MLQMNASNNLVYVQLAIIYNVEYEAVADLPIAESEIYGTSVADDTEGD
jgi:hypothetical protein